MLGWTISSSLPCLPSLLPGRVADMISTYRGRREQKTGDGSGRIAPADLSVGGLGAESIGVGSELYFGGQHHICPNFRNFHIAIQL